LKIPDNSTFQTNQNDIKSVIPNSGIIELFVTPEIKV